MDGQVKKSERANQKRRTRAELLRATRKIVEQGRRPSVAEVADTAGISRATAYRYFSTPDEIIREAVFDAAAETIRLLPAERSGTNDVAARLDDLISQVFHMVLDNESIFRAFLASAVTNRTPLRRGTRRLSWLTETLEPLRAMLPPADFQRLVFALSLFTGVETLVVMRDICELQPDAAEDLVRWAARTLLSGAVAGNPDEKE